uniref:Secreted protein n=1 Tax=Trichogramma kaykai TaxID=54128 RepID=A0ABD2XGK3_9HYME
MLLLLVAVLRVHSPAAEDSRESRGREIVTRNHKNSCGRRRLRPKHVPWQPSLLLLRPLFRLTYLFIPALRAYMKLYGRFIFCHWDGAETHQDSHMHKLSGRRARLLPVLRSSYINSTVTLEDNNRRSSLKSIASEPHQVCLAVCASRLAFPFRPQFCIACVHRAREQQRPLYSRPQILRFLPPGGTFFLKRSSVRKKQRCYRLLTLCCCNSNDDIVTYTRAKRICTCGTPQ